MTVFKMEKYLLKIIFIDKLAIQSFPAAGSILQTSNQEFVLTVREAS